MLFSLVCVRQPLVGPARGPSRSDCRRVPRISVCGMPPNGCGVFGPAYRYRALTRPFALAILAHRANEEFVRRVTTEWEKVGRQTHIDVDNLLLLTEPYWDMFFCDSERNCVVLSVVDKIRLQGKLITR